MKRLTFEGNFCDIAMCDEVRGGSFCEDGDCSQRKIWERLKAIENILGDEYDLDRLRKLAQADRERDAAVDCIYKIEDDLDRGTDNDWAREHISEWESQKEA